MQLKIILLFTGLLLFIINQYVQPLPELFQMVLFLIGLTLLGIPHGGADQLIAMRSSENGLSSFSSRKFNLIYCGNIVLASAVFYLFPFLSTTIFLLMAAYHFGETDLSHFRLKSVLGKLLQFQYGILILCVILLPHFPAVQHSLLVLHINPAALSILQWISLHPHQVLLINLGVFILAKAVYSMVYKKITVTSWKEVISLVILALIIYQLPLLLSFTFYFVFWHSIFSLKNILNYLQLDTNYNQRTVLKEILKNSLIVFIGMCITGLFCFVWFNNENLFLYAIFALAVLTGPHMHVMHNMYSHISKSEKLPAS